MSIPVSTLTGSNTINQMMYNVNTIKDLAANSAGFVANTVFQSALANTNAYIATKVNTSTFNSALANTNSYIATKVNTSTFNSALANTNAYIATVFATERAALANTNAYIASVSSSSFTGPGSSTDNAVVRFDGTSGSTAQNSGVTIADDNSMIISGSSSGDMLRITQTGAGNALLVEDSTNPDSTPFVIDSSGNVGIGTSSPSALLDVDGTTRLGGAVTLGGTLDMNGNALTVDSATFNEGGEAKFLAAGTVSTDQSYDETTERDIQMTVSAAVNLDFETPNSGMVYSHVLWITQDGTGGRVVTIRDGTNTEATWIGVEPNWSGLAPAALTKVSVFYSPSGTLYAMEFDAS